MSTLSRDRFLHLVERSRLVSGELLAEAVSRFHREAPADQQEDVQLCAEYLVQGGLLTRWQCDKLLEGRYKGFFLGKYILLDHLGRGGMSSVYLAAHSKIRHRVAIKVLPKPFASDEGYLARFNFEAQATATLNHPNVVRAYDLDQVGDHHYLVMEYVDGRDLQALVDEQGPLEYTQAADFIAQAAAGLDHAHAAGLVHRDIKPGNLLVDRQGTVKILDLGLAKFTGEKDVSAAPGQEDQVVGTADYLAPEQAIDSQGVDARADLYALGCTLYFLLTGQAPFSKGTTVERIAAHRQQLAPSILLTRPDAPPELVEICRKLMEKSPENRFASAAEVRRALIALSGGEVTRERVAPGFSASAAKGSSSAARSRPASRVNLVSGSSDNLPVSASDLETAAELTETKGGGPGHTVRMLKDVVVGPPASGPPPVPPLQGEPLSARPRRLQTAEEEFVEPGGSDWQPPRKRRSTASQAGWLVALLTSALLLAAALTALAVFNR